MNEYEIHQLAFDILNESLVTKDSDPEVVELRVDGEKWRELWEAYFNNERGYK